MLAALSHRFEPGGFVAVVGESGVGQSTLLIAARRAGRRRGPRRRRAHDGAGRRRRHAPAAHAQWASSSRPSCGRLTLAGNVALPLLLNGSPDPARATADAGRGRPGQGAAPTSRASCRAASWASRTPCAAPPAAGGASRPAKLLEPDGILRLLRAEIKASGAGVVVTPFRSTAAMANRTFGF
ncbi:hypothetical protein [Massilia phosphatilytica]